MASAPTFGQVLRETRLSAGLSQTDLAEASSIPKSRLSRYENGHILPSIGSLRRLARALSTSEGQLLGQGPGVREAFFDTLEERGVGLRTAQDAVRLAHRFADMVDGEKRSQA